MKDNTRKTVFNAFRTSDGFELYLKILDIIQDEIKQTISKQLSERIIFQTTMMNKINNAGWNEEPTHREVIDIIQNEEYKISNIADKYGIDRDEY